MAVALATAVLAGVFGALAPPAFAGALTNPAWSVSSSTPSATGVTYSFSFTTATTSNLNTVTMTVPAGTAGSAAVGTVTPAAVATGGSVALASNTLTYSFTSASINSGTAVSIQITGLTNTSTKGNYTSTITTKNGAAAVDSGTTSSGAGAVVIATALTSPGWSVSSPVTGATNVSYTYTFTTATTATLSSVRAILPSGTAGTAQVGTVTPASVATGGSVGVSGQVLTYSFTSASINSGTAVSIKITGLTNTSTNGTYTAAITTSGASVVDTGTTPGVNITASLTSLSWTLSNPAASATAVAYTYAFHTATTATQNKVTMTVPTGTAGTPAVGTVTPVSVATGGSVSLSGTTLTYTFSSASINSATAVSIQITGLTNTGTPGSYSSTITTFNSGNAIDSGSASATVAGNLTSPAWSVSKAGSGDTAVGYTYTFTTATTSSLSNITMTVPAGTAGSPVVGGFSGIPSGSVSLASNTLTYSFTPSQVNSGTAVSIQITGLTNTGTPGGYTSTITTVNSGNMVDIGVTPAVVIAASDMTSPVWSASSTVTGATSVSYTYGYISSGTATKNKITMTVPAGTGGSPAVGSVRPAAVASGGSVSLSGTTLTYTFTATAITAGTAVSVQITGLTNTSTAGTYTSTISTFRQTGVPDESGITPSVTIAGSLTSLGWSVSNSAPSATGVGYTYTFTTSGSAATINTVKMTVPSGTAGTPAVGTVTPAIVAAGGSVSLSGTTLTYMFTSHSVGPSQAVSIQITGMANTGTPGSYTSAITTFNGATPVDQGVTPATAIGGGLVNPVWTVSSQSPGATGVIYTYTFTTATTATLNKITVSLPAGTSGTPAIGTVSPAAVAAGGSLSGSTNLLIYTFTAASIPAGTAVSIQITGVANTSTTGVYSSVITTYASGGNAVDAGTTPGVVIGGAINPLWGVSSAALGATGVTYTYRFTTASSSNLDTVSMTVPAGTAGTPAVGTVTPAGLASGGSVFLSGSTLYYTFNSTGVTSGTNVSIQITGLTNTSTTGTYTSVLATYNAGNVVDGGTTPAVSFPASLTLTSPGSLTWNVTATGSDLVAVDAVSSDQQLTVTDSTGAAPGWHITVAATTFTNGSHTLPNSSTFGLTGSLSSFASGTPSTACVGSCVLPTNTTSYPVPITTAASSPSAVTVYDTSAGTGVGTITIGGHNAAHPVGWWVSVPASAVVGSYTSTVTITLVSGP